MKDCYWLNIPGSATASDALFLVEIETGSEEKVKTDVHWFSSFVSCKLNLKKSKFLYIFIHIWSEKKQQKLAKIVTGHQPALRPPHIEFSSTGPCMHLEIEMIINVPVSFRLNFDILYIFKCRFQIINHLLITCMYMYNSINNRYKLILSYTPYSVHTTGNLSVAFTSVLYITQQMKEKKSNGSYNQRILTEIPCGKL